MIENNIVIIPAYKPAKSLISLVKELGEYFSGIVVVDDGGGDEYKVIFDSLSAFDFCTVLHHEVNRGKGAALKTGLGYVISNLSVSCFYFTIILLQIYKNLGRM